MSRIGEDGRALGVAEVCDGLIRAMEEDRHLGNKFIKKGTILLFAKITMKLERVSPALTALVVYFML